jgi:hypothetical protein
VYVIDRFATGNAMANNRNEGTVLSRISNGAVMAHELGHQLGLPDIYNFTKHATNSVPDSLISKEWMPLDCTGDSGISYYEQELRHWETLRRLLMFGRGTSGPGRDIPLGDIHGVWYKWKRDSSNHWIRVYKTGSAPVSRSHIKQSGYDHR